MSGFRLQLVVSNQNPHTTPHTPLAHSRRQTKSPTSLTSPLLCPSCHPECSPSLTPGSLSLEAKVQLLLLMRPSMRGFLDHLVGQLLARAHARVAKDAARTSPP